VPAIWIARLGISPETAEKLSRDHGLSADEVGDELLCVPGLHHVWDDDSERGARAIVEVWVRSQRVLVVLYEALDPLGDAWNLGSAYPVD
jgi:hypothetical protein